MEGNKRVCVKIKLLKSSFELEVDLSSTTLDLKQKISDQTKNTPQEHRVVYKGHIMKDDETLEKLQVKNGDIIDVILLGKSLHFFI